MKINLKDKLDTFSDHWNPRIIGELNQQYVKIVKIKGEFPWHKHDNEDELFFVIKGELIMRYRDKVETLNEGELVIVPKGVEHSPKSLEETQIMLFEPVGILNTGEEKNEFTKETLEKI